MADAKKPAVLIIGGLGMYCVFPPPETPLARFGLRLNTIFPRTMR